MDNIIDELDVQDLGINKDDWQYYIYRMCHYCTSQQTLLTGAINSRHYNSCVDVLFPLLFFCYLSL